EPVAAGQAETAETSVEPAPEPAAAEDDQALGQAESTDPSEPSIEPETAEAEPAKEEAPAPAAE
ncbi:MAG TPA: hypothetical protein DEA68_02795, partial [Verrucomicrobiales bacterium]|nr:hypothetical protein [Verrucomicrobiales bacterium]